MLSTVPLIICNSFSTSLRAKHLAQHCHSLPLRCSEQPREVGIIISILQMRTSKLRDLTCQGIHSPRFNLSTVLLHLRQHLYVTVALAPQYPLGLLLLIKMPSCPEGTQCDEEGSHKFIHTFLQLNMKQCGMSFEPTKYNSL